MRRRGRVLLIAEYEGTIDIIALIEGIPSQNIRIQDDMIIDFSEQGIETSQVGRRGKAAPHLKKGSLIPARFAQKEHTPRSKKGSAIKSAPKRLPPGTAWSLTKRIVDDDFFCLKRKGHCSQRTSRENVHVIRDMGTILYLGERKISI